MPERSHQLQWFVPRAREQSGSRSVGNEEPLGELHDGKHTRAHLRRVDGRQSRCRVCRFGMHLTLQLTAINLHYAQSTNM
jgi:hypothetical protein